MMKIHFNAVMLEMRRRMLKMKERRSFCFCIINEVMFDLEWNIHFENLTFHASHAS